MSAPSSKSKPTLTPHEATLFELLLRIGDASVPEVIDALPPSLPADRGQLRALLDGMVAKGLIEHRSGSHDHYFVPPSNLAKLKEASAIGLEPFIEFLERMERERLSRGHVDPSLTAALLRKLFFD